MLSINTTPVHLEYRQSRRINHNVLQPHVLKEHVTSASYQSNPTHLSSYNKRPHLQIILDKNLTIQALVDTGSSICIGDSSLIQYLQKQSPIASPVNVTDVHNTKRPTLGCFQAHITVEDPLPYPIENEEINILHYDFFIPTVPPSMTAALVRVPETMMRMMIDVIMLAEQSILNDV